MAKKINTKTNSDQSIFYSYPRTMLWPYPFVHESSPWPDHVATGPMWAKPAIGNELVYLEYLSFQMDPFALIWALC